MRLGTSAVAAGVAVTAFAASAAKDAVECEADVPYTGKFIRIHTVAELLISV